jgi:hypothetical protein
LNKINGKSGICWRAAALGITFPAGSWGTTMAHVDIEHLEQKPRLTIAAQRQADVGHAKNMLVATIIGSTMILVVAALFMTMF